MLQFRFYHPSHIVFLLRQSFSTQTNFAHTSHFAGPHSPLSNIHGNESVTLHQLPFHDSHVLQLPLPPPSSLWHDYNCRTRLASTTFPFTVTPAQTRSSHLHKDRGRREGTSTLCVRCIEQPTPPMWLVKLLRVCPAVIEIWSRGVTFGVFVRMDWLLGSEEKIVARMFLSESFMHGSDRSPRPESSSVTSPHLLSFMAKGGSGFGNYMHDPTTT